MIDDLKRQARSLHIESRLSCDSDPALSLQKAELCLILAKENSLTEEAILARENIAYQTWHGGNLNQALEWLIETRAERQKIKFFDHYDWCAKSIALINWGQGNYDVAFQTIYDAIQLLDEYATERDKCLCYWALGVFFYDLKDYRKSYEFYTKSLELSEEIELLDNNITAYNLIGIACCAKEQGNVEDAFQFLEKAIIVSDRYKQWMQRSRCFFELGSLNISLGNYQQASEFIKNSLELRKEFQSIPGIISCLVALSDIDQQMGNLESSITYVQEALSMAEKLGSKTKRSQCHEKLASLYSANADYKSAFHSLELFYQLKSEVSGEKANNKIKQLEADFSRLKSEKEAQIQRLINVELKGASELIKTKNEQILSSVSYAALIQNAILPPISNLNSWFQDSFIFYQPKDIVAGDFYWIEQTPEGVLFAVADCTGHGVPGALMSVLCSTALSRCVREYGLFSPAQILNQTRHLISEYFSINKSGIQDGMEIGLCRYDKKNGNLWFSGARRDLFILRKNEVTLLKGDKQPIADFEFACPFEESMLSPEIGDRLYLFSDGFGDQFDDGGNRKFGQKNLRDLLLNLGDMPVSEQENALRETFRQWQGQQPQTDDVCVLGLEF
jgi:serine phosphatase RsbU (regulator of sigma subunit)